MGNDVIARFAGRELPVMLLELTDPGFEQRIRLGIAASAFADDPPDLAARFTVSRRGRNLFAGHVVDVETDANADHRYVLTGARAASWSDRLTGGLGLARKTSKAEVLYQIARTNDIPPQGIHIEGWRPRRERFVVVVPVEGAMEKGALSAGGVVISTDLGDTGTIETLATLGPTELNEAFLEPGAWAVAVVEAATLYDAETAGVAAARRVVERLALGSRYSLSVTPGGGIRAFHRHQALEYIRLRPIAGVVGLESQDRAWLRGYEYATLRTPLRADAFEGLMEALSSEDQAMDQAVSAWRRAVDEPDPLVAAGAVSEALEWYARGSKAPKRFSDEARSEIVARAIDGLPGDQAAVVARVLNEGLTRPGLMPRVRAAAAADNVPVTEEEFSVLDHLRSARNKVQHGDNLVPVTRDEALLGLAVVNRLLMFRLHRAAGPQEPIPEVNDG
jgi:hypothetical protein